MHINEIFIYNFGIKTRGAKEPNDLKKKKT